MLQYKKNACITIEGVQQMVFVQSERAWAYKMRCLGHSKCLPGIALLCSCSVVRCCECDAVVIGLGLNKKLLLLLFTIVI